MEPRKPKLVDKARSEDQSAQSDASNAELVNPVVVPSTQLTAWMHDQQLSFFVLLGLTAGALYLTYVIFRPFWIALFLSLIMAIAFFPLHRRVRQRIRNLTLASLITTTLATLFILVPFVLVSIRIATEAATIYRGVLQPLSSTSTWPDHFNSLIHQTAERTGVPEGQLKAEITSRVRELGTWLLGFAGSLARRFTQQLMTFVLGAIFLFSLLRSSDEFRAGALSMLPLTPQRARELASAVNKGVIADIYGMFAVGVAEGALIAVGFWMVGLSSPWLWGAVAAVLSCMPFVGVSLVWIPACIILLLRENWAAAIFLFIWGLLIVATADGVVRSRVVGGRVKVNSFLVTLSIMGGLAAFGGIGIFAGPVILVLVAALVRILREEHANVQGSRGRAA